MLVHNFTRYYPLEISQVISADGEVLYDRNKRNKAYCYIDLQTADANETER